MGGEFVVEFDAVGLSSMMPGVLSGKTQRLGAEGSFTHRFGTWAGMTSRQSTDLRSPCMASFSFPTAWWPQSGQNSFKVA